MREIVFDTETTGLDPDNGDKVVEIGMVEIIDLLPTGKVFHCYINPMRSMPAEAQKVHGLSEAFLRDFPVFGDSEICDAMLEFIQDSQLVAHNAEFDRKFLNAELKSVGLPIIEQKRCVDTVLLARKKFPGAPASLDALCKRFAIDLKERDKHGALIDAKLLAAVYLELKGGREREFGFLDSKSQSKTVNFEKGVLPIKAITRQQRPNPLPPRLSEAELKAHEEYVKSIGENAFWLSN